MSAIVLKPNGKPLEILRNAWTDSHEDLVTLFSLRDNKEGAFARVEFKPEDKATLDQPDTYKLRIDEQRCPDWFDDDLKAKVDDRMRGWVRAMVVTGEVPMLCGGVYVLAEGAKVVTVKNAIIHAMMPGSQVVLMRGSSQVGEMWESSRVGEMWESSRVGVMRGSSQVGANHSTNKLP